MFFQSWGGRGSARLSVWPQRFATGAAVGLILLGQSAVSGTWTPSDPRGLDPFGIGCYQYDPGDLQSPFGDGKALRSAPLCIQNPCRGALDRYTLSLEIVGRPVTDGEWHTYYTRYAEYCRSETRGSTSITDRPILDLTTVIIPPESEPPIAIYVPPETEDDSTTIVYDPEETTDLTTMPVIEITTGNTTLEPPVSNVPLPASFTGLLAGICILGWRRMAHRSNSV